MLVLIIEAIGILGMEVFVFPDSTRPIIDATTMMRVIGPTTILP